MITGAGAGSGSNCCTYGTVERGISEAGMGSPEKCTVGKELSGMRSCLSRRHSMLEFIVGYIAMCPPPLTPLIAVVVMMWTRLFINTAALIAPGTVSDGPTYKPNCQKLCCEFSSALAAWRYTKRTEKIGNKRIILRSVFF